MSAPRVSGFTVLRELSSDGQACVWRAKDIETGKYVSLKVGEEPLSVPLEVFDRYVLGLVAATEHPALVTVHSGGLTDDGAPFIVFDGCEVAQPFSQAMLEGCSLEHILQVMIWLASGVERLHHEGLVHGAIAPEHLLLGPHGKYELSGFAVPGCFLNGRLAPEVMRGQEATSASDVFGLGVLAWEFVGSAHIPVKLQTLLAAAVADDPAHRLPVVRDLIEGFQRVQKKLGYELSCADRPVATPVNEATRLDAALNVDDETQLRVVAPDDATRVRSHATWQQGAPNGAPVNWGEADTLSVAAAGAMKPQLMGLPEEALTDQVGATAFAPLSRQQAPSLYKPRAVSPAVRAVAPRVTAAQQKHPLLAPTTQTSAERGKHNEPVSRIRHEVTVIALGATGIVCVSLACLLLLVT